MLFDAVCIWGWPLHSHTHSYIHNGFFRAAQQLGVPTVWLDNVRGAGDNLPSNTLFITECQVDSHIPLRADCFYALHNCDGSKYQGLKTVSIQCLVEAAEGDVFLDKPWLLSKDSCLLMPWATDLLPHEIQANMDKLETIHANRGSEVQFVGYFIDDPWRRAERHLSSKNMCLTKCGGYGLKNVSVEENMRRIQSGRIAPALQPEEQVRRGYLPCRILKNISYGALGISNNPHVRRLFGDELFSHLIVGNSVEEALDKGLEARLDVDAQRALMRHIKDNHTYVNRLQELDAMFAHLGHVKSPPPPPKAPSVLHITFHAGCEKDLQAVAQVLGWNLDTIMIMREPGATNDWYKLTDEVVTLFWERFEKRFLSADVVIVSDTAPLARLFVKRPVKKLVVWVCNRINYACTVSTYHEEVKQLSRQPWVRYVAYTPFETEYAARERLDVLWRGTIRPLGATVPRLENGDRSSEVFIGTYHNDAIAWNLRSIVEPHVVSAGLKIGDANRYDGAADLKTYAAVIHIPYAASNLALFEALANEIPYLIPSKDLMQRMMDKRERLPLRTALFTPDHKAGSMEWYRFADCFLTFDRFEDIPALLDPITLASCRLRMRNRYPIHREQVLAQWKEMVEDGDSFLPLAPMLRNALFPYCSRGTFEKWFGRVPQQRDVTFAEVIRTLRSLGRAPRILELGTSRSFVDGRFPGCNTDDTSVWEPHVMDRWDWSAGCFTKVMSVVFPDAIIKTVDLSPAHLRRCRVMCENTSSNIEFIHASSEDFLNRCRDKFDLVYMDTGDMTPIAETSNLHFREAQLVSRVLTRDGLLLLDDVHSCVPLEAGESNPLGKAYRSLPWLQDHGFYVSMDEYQVLLRRTS